MYRPRTASFCNVASWSVSKAIASVHSTWAWRLYFGAATLALAIPFAAIHFDGGGLGEGASGGTTLPERVAVPAQPSPVTPTLDDLVRQCAPAVSPNTLLAIMHTESQFKPLALHVNGELRLQRAPARTAEAIAWSTWLIRHGHSVDMGLMQINSRNLTRLQMTVADAFEPCRNIQAAAAILTEQYLVAAQLHKDSTDAVLAAISAYNTGNFRDGFRNGYVAKVLRNSKPR